MLPWMLVRFVLRIFCSLLGQFFEFDHLLMNLFHRRVVRNGSISRKCTSNDVYPILNVMGTKVLVIIPIDSLALG